MTIFGLAFFKNLMIILQIICTHVTKAFSFFCFALNSDSQQKIGFSNVTQVDMSLFCFQAFTHFLTQLFCRIKQYCICYSCCEESDRGYSVCCLILPPMAKSRSVPHRGSPLFCGLHAALRILLSYWGRKHNGVKQKAAFTGSSLTCHETNLQHHHWELHMIWHHCGRHCHHKRSANKHTITQTAI